MRDRSHQRLTRSRTTACRAQNLALLDLAEVQAPLPEVIEDKLTAQDDVLVCAFNRRGNLLAGGCRNGAVNIWDFDTHGVAQTLVGHTQRVSSVSWTRSSRRLLSGSADGKLILWDVLRGVATQTVDLEAEVGHAALHPRQRALSLACVGTAAAAQAFIVGLKTPDDPRLPLMAAPEGAAAAADGGGGGASSAGAPAPDAEVKRREGTVSFACFACDGAMVMLGTTRGTCHLLDTSTRTELHSLRLPGGAAIKSLSLSRDGKSFLANSADRVIRAYSLERVLAGERPPPRELQDVRRATQPPRRKPAAAPPCTPVQSSAAPSRTAGRALAPRVHSGTHACARSGTHASRASARAYRHMRWRRRPPTPMSCRCRWRWSSQVVNRVQWAHAGFSSESEHVVGTANSATDHLVYIWDMHGLLVNILGQVRRMRARSPGHSSEGTTHQPPHVSPGCGLARPLPSDRLHRPPAAIRPLLAPTSRRSLCARRRLWQGEKVKDGATFFACHPTRPILAACARSGAVYVWTKRCVAPSCCFFALRAALSLKLSLTLSLKLPRTVAVHRCRAPVALHRVLARCLHRCRARFFAPLPCTPSCIVAIHVALHRCRASCHLRCQLALAVVVFITPRPPSPRPVPHPPRAVPPHRSTAPPLYHPIAPLPHRPAAPLLHRPTAPPRLTAPLMRRPRRGGRYSENWSAFAPDFKELDENEEYAEREDEFDIKPQADFKANDVDEDEVIDILTVERTEVSREPLTWPARRTRCPTACLRRRVAHAAPPLAFAWALHTESYPIPWLGLSLHTAATIHSAGRP